MTLVGIFTGAQSDKPVTHLSPLRARSDWLAGDQRSYTVGSLWKKLCPKLARGNEENQWWTGLLMMSHDVSGGHGY